MIVGGAVVFLGLATGLVHAEVPPVPSGEGLPTLTEVPKPSAQIIGWVELATGDVRLISSKGIYSVSELRTPLVYGDVIATGTDGRCHLRIAGGDSLQLGKNSLISLNIDKKKSWTANVWQGSLVAYGFPSLTGKKLDHSIHLPRGGTLFSLGKIGLSVNPSDQKSRLLVFKNSAEWQDTNGESRTIPKGRGLTIGIDSVEEETLPNETEKRFTIQTSPEGSLIVAGLKAYEEKAYDRAIKTLNRVQAVFPYNSLAAYYLGLTHLATEDLGPTISQWRRYEKIDPEGAAEHEISKHLTILISKRMKEEISDALAMEQALTDAKPEPNSIAVPPFSNKGSKKFAVLAKGITAMIIADLSKVPGVKVLERAKMQKLVDEIQLAQSGLVSEGTAVRAGRLMRADKLIMGDYSVE